MVKNGQRTFNLNVKVPADVVSNVDAEIKTHAKWMRDNHSYDDTRNRQVTWEMRVIIGQCLNQLPCL